MHVHITKFYKLANPSPIDGGPSWTHIFCYWKQSSNKHSNVLEYVFLHTSAFIAIGCSPKSGTAGQKVFCLKKTTTQKTIDITKRFQVTFPPTMCHVDVPKSSLDWRWHPLVFLVVGGFFSIFSSPVCITILNFWGSFWP